MKQASRETRLGLMSSVPGMHAIEGRRWHELWEALHTHRPPRHRPHYFPYQESTGEWIPMGAVRLEVPKQFRPPQVESYPEIENWAFGPYSKSQTLSWAQSGATIPSASLRAGSGCGCPWPSGLLNRKLEACATLAAV